MSALFVSIRSENKLFKGLLNNENLSQELAIRNIELTINSNVSPDFFTSDFRSWLYTAITEHYFSYSAALTVDLLRQKITKKYKKDQAIEDANALLEKILQKTFEQEELLPLIDELKNLHQLRKVFDTTTDVLNTLKAIKEGAASVSAVPLIQKLENTIEVVNIQNSKERIIQEDAFANVPKDIDEIRDMHNNPEKYKGIDTGIEPLTLATNGWQKGDLITVIGRTGQGKSIVLLNFAYSAWIAGNNVLYVSIEMPIKQQKRRLYSRMTGVKYFKIKNSQHLSSEELIFFEEKIKEIKSQYESDFVILDAPSKCSANFIESRINTYEKATKKKFNLIIVDPIYLMVPNQRNDDDPVGEISWDLKLLGRKLDVPVITANQINREGHKRHLQGRDMDAMDSASSDRLGQNSDVMIGIISDDQQWLKLTIIKYRDGKGPTLYLKRKFDVMRIEYDPESNENQDVMAQIVGEEEDGTN